jgi:hypothetical protein
LGTLLIRLLRSPLAGRRQSEQHGEVDDWELDAISDREPTSRSNAARFRWSWILASGALGAVVGFLIGAVTTGGSLPKYACADRVLALIDAKDLPDEPLEILAPIRLRKLGDPPLPLPGSMTTELVGSATGHQEFRPANGRLVVTVELPEESIDRTAEIVRGGTTVVARVRILAPFCKTKPAERD